MSHGWTGGVRNVRPPRLAGPLTIPRSRGNLLAHRPDSEGMRRPLRRLQRVLVIAGAVDQRSDSCDGGYQGALPASQASPSRVV